MAIEAQAELELTEYSQQVRDADAALAPTFHVLTEQLGGGYSATDTYPNKGEVEPIVFAGVRQVFAPRITNISAVDLFVRFPGQAWPQTPMMTRYTVHKADTITLRRVGMELQIYCGTHQTDAPLGPNGERPYYQEKDQIPNFFVGFPLE